MFYNLFLQCFTVRGCKFLRELYFLPQSDPDVRSRGQLMPKVVSYLLKNLNQLQVIINCYL